MPDIAMCAGVKFRSECPLRENCYRFRAIPTEYRQAYFTEAPFEIQDSLSVSCDYYIPLQKGDRILQNGEKVTHGKT